MPGTWQTTVESHRDTTREAIARAVGNLVHHGGLTTLTMSAIAREAGVSRATLYRYVHDAGEAVDLWRSFQIDEHLQQLRTVAQDTAPQQRLTAVLQRYAVNRQHRHGDAHAAVPHGEAVLADAKGAVATLISELLTAEAARGTIRTDVPVSELALYAISALEAAAQMHSREAAMRLARVVEQSLRSVAPPP